MGDRLGSADMELASAAQQVLLANHTGKWTRPSAKQYPHQWNWDSAFISLGWATFDWDRACQEIESMLAARWREGMIPHIHYDPRYLDDYFPGPDRWPRAQEHVAVAGEMTSGISNPTVLATAARLVGERERDPQKRNNFWRRVIDPLAGWLAYMSKGRQLDGAPLVASVHPWETGWDNSPRWDHLSRAGLKPKHPYHRKDTVHVSATNRPSNKDYDSYVALAELLGHVNYDIEEYRRISPFCVYDVALDSLWYRAATDLNVIAAQIDHPPIVGEDHLLRFREAFEEHHWDKELSSYVDWDCVAGERIHRPTAAGLVALTAGLPDAGRAREIWGAYDERQGKGCRVKTTPMSDPAFDPVNYWRGPVWLNVNWLIFDGLRRAGMHDEAAMLCRQSLDLVRHEGFYEYFDAQSGSGLGASSFSWTAAITLIFLAEESADADGSADRSSSRVI